MYWVDFGGISIRAVQGWRGRWQASLWLFSVWSSLIPPRSSNSNYSVKSWFDVQQFLWKNQHLYIYEVPISLKWVLATVLGLVNFVQVRRNVVICRSFEIELWYIHDCRKCGLWNTDIYWSWKYSWFLINLIDNGVWMISLSREVMQTVIYGT